ncbi:MAG: hypothetical protein K6C08_12050, partial [Oscillospiraceae bacterium]|nr:hypothetical protein [Oscillospiraceae bacterium]
MKRKRILAIFMLAAMVLTGLPGDSASAEVSVLPAVRTEMCEPEYWTAGREGVTDILADMQEIDVLNQKILSTPACMMTDMRNAPEYFNAQILYGNLWGTILRDSSGMMNAGYFDS